MKPYNKTVAGFWIFTFMLTAAYAPVLFQLVRFSLGSDLESYIPMIPVISVYLIFSCAGAVWPFKFPFGGWRNWKVADKTGMKNVDAGGAGAPPGPGVRQRLAAILLWALSGAMLVLQWSGLGFDGSAGEAAWMFLPMVAFVTALLGGVLFWYGMTAWRPALFPLLFLYFMVPIPDPAAHWLRLILQQGSADAAHAMFWLARTPVFRDGQTFCLPGLIIEVAEECSGIHSSLVLLITSLVAGRIFLRTLSARAVLTFIVVPLSLIRNGFRIVTISLLTIHVDPGIIHSPLHHRGGPVFFVLSLMVLLVVLWGLRKMEGRKEG